MLLCIRDQSYVVLACKRSSHGTCCFSLISSKSGREIHLEAQNKVSHCWSQASSVFPCRLREMLGYRVLTTFLRKPGKRESCRKLWWPTSQRPTYIKQHTLVLLMIFWTFWIMELNKGSSCDIYTMPSNSFPPQILTDNQNLLLIARKSWISVFFTRSSN